MTLHHGLEGTGCILDLTQQHDIYRFFLPYSRLESIIYQPISDCLKQTDCYVEVGTTLKNICVIAICACNCHLSSTRYRSLSLDHVF